MDDYIHPLKRARKSHPRNLTQEQLAGLTGLAKVTIERAERGEPVSLYTRQQLCAFFNMTPQELGLVPQRYKVDTSPNHASGSSDLLQTTEQVQVAIQNLEEQGIDMNYSRRFFLQLLGVGGTTLAASPKDLLFPAGNEPTPVTNVSVSTIENLLTITQQYRSLQRAGFAIEDSLRSHISLIQSTLETTTHSKFRQDLWRILAQSQLLARHSITKKYELPRARTWNESAIASAQFSGDRFLLGATLGHLGHLSISWQRDPRLASQLIEQAQQYTKGHQVNGWIAMVEASIAALESKKEKCEASIAKATETASTLPKGVEWADLYYTDFNIPGVDAFAGNSFLQIGEPAKALQRLTSINLAALAENRHASAFYDIACAYMSLGELEATQDYAFCAIDKALETGRFYIIPRLFTLARRIQEKDPHESHAASIIDYAQNASLKVREELK